MRALAASKSRRPLGCTQVTEIIATPGIVLAAPLPPPGCDLATVYSCAIAAKAGAPVEAAAFMAMLSGDPGRDSRRQLGFV
jgi:molybdate transport system substrate-binding protein